MSKKGKKGSDKEEVKFEPIAEGQPQIIKLVLRPGGDGKTEVDLFDY
jgi:hypothetical protein